MPVYGRRYVAFEGMKQSMSKSQAFWDKASKNYDKTEERFEYIHSRSRENTKKHLRSDDVVLDYGCGTGTATCEFASLVKEIHAVDTSSKMIELAKQKASKSGSENAHFVQTDLFDNRYQRESFDVILAFNMLHTVGNVSDVMQRIHDLLKPNGKVISVTPCLKEKMSFWVGVQIQLVRLLTATGVIPIAIRRLRSSDVDDLMARAGFQTIEAEKLSKGATSYFVVAKK